MTDQELEQRLRTALEHAAPDHLEALLSRCELRRGNVIPMTVPARKPRKKAAMAWLAAACLALVFSITRPTPWLRSSPWMSIPAWSWM